MTLPKTKVVTKRLKWYQGSEYQCQICFQMFFASSQLLQHVEDVHTLTETKYVDSYGELKTKDHLYKCQVCQQSVARNLDAIER